MLCLQTFTTPYSTNPRNLSLAWKFLSPPLEWFMTSPLLRTTLFSQTCQWSSESTSFSRANSFSSSIRKSQRDTESWRDIAKTLTKFNGLSFQITTYSIMLMLGSIPTIKVRLWSRCSDALKPRSISTLPKSTHLPVVHKPHFSQDLTLTLIRVLLIGKLLMKPTWSSQLLSGTSSAKRPNTHTLLYSKKKSQKLRLVKTTPTLRVSLNTTLRMKKF